MLFGGNIDLSNRAEVAIPGDAQTGDFGGKRVWGEPGLSSGLESTAKWLEYLLQLALCKIISYLSEQSELIVDFKVLRYFVTEKIVLKNDNMKNMDSHLLKYLYYKLKGSIHKKSAWK